MLGTVKKSLDPLQIHELEDFGGRIKRFGVNFAVCDADGGLVLLCEGGKFKSSPEQLAEYGRQALNPDGRNSCSDEAGVPVWRFGDANVVLAVVLKSACLGNKRQKAVGTALIDLGAISSLLVHNVTCDVNDANLVQTDSEYFVEMLGLLAKSFQAQIKAEEQIEKVGTELAQTYEELVLLHRLSTNMKVTEADSNFLQMACDSLTEIVFVEGIAILLEKTIDDKQQLVIAAGSGLIDIDEQTAAVLHSRLTDEINSGKEALLDSEVDSAFRYDWPDSIKNIIAVPLCGKDKTESHFAGRIQNGSRIMGCRRWMLSAPDAS